MFLWNKLHRAYIVVPLYDVGVKFLRQGEIAPQTALCAPVIDPWANRNGGKYF